LTQIWVETTQHFFFRVLEKSNGQTIIEISEMG